MDGFKLIPEVINVAINKDGRTASESGAFVSEKKWKIQDIMLGAGGHRRPVPWTDGLLKPNTECRAQVLENGKLRIV